MIARIVKRLDWTRLGLLGAVLLLASACSAVGWNWDTPMSTVNPKSDFGITVLIGVSQFQPTALQAQASRSTAPSRPSRVQSRRFTMRATVEGR